MTNGIGASAVIVVWIALIYATHYASNREDRRELWRSIMTGLCGLSVRVRRGR